MRTVKSCCLFLAMPIIIPETSAIPLTTLPLLLIHLHSLGWARQLWPETIPPHPISNYQLILIDSFCGRWYNTLQEWNGEWHLGKSDDDDLWQLSLSGPLGLTTTIASSRTWGDSDRLPMTRRIQFTQLDSSWRQGSESNWLNPIGNSWPELSLTHVLLLLFLSSSTTTDQSVVGWIRNRNCNWNWDISLFPSPTTTNVPPRLICGGVSIDEN